MLSHTLGMEQVTRSEAKARGLKRYFTGGHCMRGHLAERITSNGKCIECDRENSLRWFRRNRDAELERMRAYDEANRDAKNAFQRQWCAQNRDRVRANESTRKASELNATPPWADREAIRAVYAEAERLTRETGVRHEVDHIVPLRGKTVCGLHIAANLQPLPASENLAKGNRHWPGMW